jgi:proline iminopeptidase
VAQAWPGAELHLVEQEGHGAGGSRTQDLILEALDRFALRS